MILEYGDTVKDLVTKVEGIITGHADYVTGCDKYLIQPINKKKDEKPETLWFDENRLKKIGEDKDTKAIFEATKAKSKLNLGADTPAPSK